MVKRYVAMVAIAGCGGAHPASIGNEAAPTAKLGVRKADNASCPPGALDALAPGWQLDGDETPSLDACVHARLVDGGGWAVYASADRPSDSKSEEGYPIRRVIFDEHGKIAIEGELTGGNWMFGGARLDAAVDVDGDGVDELVEIDPIDPVAGAYHLMRVAGGQLQDLGVFASDRDEPGEDGVACAASWTATAGRPGLDVTPCKGEPVVHVTLEQGKLVVPSPAPPPDTE